MQSNAVALIVGVNDYTAFDASINNAPRPATALQWGMPERLARYAPDAHGVPVVGLSVVVALPHHAAAIASVEVAREGGEPADIVPLIAGELAKIAAGLLPRYTCLGLVAGEVVAYARCMQRTADPALPAGWYLSGINVLPRWRRRGIGAALTAHRLAWLRERTAVARYTTSMDNRASLAMHRRFGFTEQAAGVLTPSRGQPLPGRILMARL